MEVQPTNVSIPKSTFSPPGPTPLASPDLSRYLDYRIFLCDFFEFKKSQTKNDLRPYSYAMFSAAADIKSPNYLKMIIEGRRNLSAEMVGKFSQAMNLSKDEAIEFRMLVEFGHASDPSERNFLLKSIVQYRVQKKVKSGEINLQLYQRFPNWVGWILYAMLDLKNFEFNIETLRKKLKGKASLEEIKSAFENLALTGKVKKDESTGRWKKANQLSENFDELPVSLVRQLQAELMSLGLESLFHDEPQNREFGTLTLALTQVEFEDLRFQLRKLRKQVHKDNSIHRMSSEGEKVYQLNLELFPLTD